VFVESNGRAERRQVAIGRRSGLQTQILDGLEEGDRVITHPATDLSEGMRVEAR
jgi:HlyD family secretion protein